MAKLIFSFFTFEVFIQMIELKKDSSALSFFLNLLTLCIVDYQRIDYQSYHIVTDWKFYENRIEWSSSSKRFVHPNGFCKLDHFSVLDISETRDLKTDGLRRRRDFWRLTEYVSACSGVSFINFRYQSENLLCRECRHWSSLTFCIETVRKVSCELGFALISNRIFDLSQCFIDFQVVIDRFFFLLKKREYGSSEYLTNF